VKNAWSVPLYAVLISGGLVTSGIGLVASATQVHQYLESDTGKPVKKFIEDRMRQLALPAPTQN
jgi:hypothetical protein